MYITGITPGDWHTTAVHAMGSIGLFLDAQGAKQFKYVKLLNETTAASAFNQDMVAYLEAPADDDEVNQVVSDFSDGETKPIGAGMIYSPSGQLTVDGADVNSMGSTSIAYYGWVQQTGYASLRQALGGIVVGGDALLCDASTDKALTLATAVDDPICAFGINDAAKTVRLCCT